jgi:hypothetical protein
MVGKVFPVVHAFLCAPPQINRSCAFSFSGLRKSLHAGVQIAKGVAEVFDAQVVELPPPRSHSLARRGTGEVP